MSLLESNGPVWDTFCSGDGKWLDIVVRPIPNLPHIQYFENTWRRYIMNIIQVYRKRIIRNILLS